MISTALLFQYWKFFCFLWSLDRKVSANCTRHSLTGCFLLLVFGMMAPAISFGQIPSLTQQPANQTIFYGDPVTFKVTAAGTTPFAYQWYRNNAPVSGANTNIYTVSSVKGGDNNAGFFVRVTNVVGAVTSSVAVLTIDFGLPGPAVTNRILNYTNVWKFNQSNNLDGVNWTVTNYNESGWQSGPGLLAAENNSLITPLIKTTLLAPTAPPPGLASGHADYFRAPAVLTNDFFESGLIATVRLDDGAVIYLNGSELTRIRMPSGTIINTTLATGTPAGSGGDATTDEVYSLPGASLPVGTNTLAVSVHQQSTGSSDIVWGLALDVYGNQRIRDTVAPTVSALLPPNGTTVPTLDTLEVHFSEGVMGVDTNDLLVNGSPAASVTAFAPDTYVFNFPSPPTGPVQIAWTSSNNIVDLSANSNHFAGGTYSYTIDPLIVAQDVSISEFMAANAHTIRDDDGDYSDWIEIHNNGSYSVPMAGWSLTDDPTKLAKWHFPTGVTMAPQSYLLVWASGNDRTNPAAPLHTNFKLNKSAGNYLALVLPDGVTIASSFTYPAQSDDVSYGRDRLLPNLVGYFSTPTPGAANSSVGAGFGPRVIFSQPGGTFQQPFNLTLTEDGTNAGVIRYFLVTNAASAALTSVPATNSPIYSTPLNITSNVQVRARFFPSQTNVFPGAPASETYLKITAGAAAFSSDVPIVIFYNFGGGTPPATADQNGVMMIFGTQYGRASLTNPPDLSTRMGFNIRGKSTQNFAKKSFAVETWDDYNDNKNVEVLGMPDQSDWVFYAADHFDQPYIHNPIIHDLVRSLGRYSSRVRMAEVFTNFGTGPVDYSSPVVGAYNGIYVIEEKVKVNNNRVDITKLEPEVTTYPGVTGAIFSR